MAESFHIDGDLTGAGEFAEGSPGLALGQTYAFLVPGRVTHIRWRSPSLLSGNPVSGALYQVVDSDPPISSTPGTLLKSGTFDALTPDAWVFAALPDGGQAVVPEVAYRAAVHGSPTMRYRARGTFFQTGYTRGNIYAHADNTGLFGITNLRNGTFFVAGAMAYPRDNFNATAYFVDIVFEPDSEAEGTLTSTVIDLAPALTGARESAGGLAGALGLAPALAGARESAGALAGALGLAPALAGARESLGALNTPLALTPALTGARSSSAALAGGITIRAALHGTNGETGRPVTPWPYPVGPVSGFPWPPRAVKSFSEVSP